MTAVFKMTVKTRMIVEVFVRTTICLLNVSLQVFYRGACMLKQSFFSLQYMDLVLHYRIMPCGVFLKICILLFIENLMYLFYYSVWKAIRVTFNTRQFLLSEFFTSPVPFLSCAHIILRKLSFWTRMLGQKQLQRMTSI